MHSNNPFIAGPMTTGQTGNIPGVQIAGRIYTNVVRATTPYNNLLNRAAQLAETISERQLFNQLIDGFVAAIKVTESVLTDTFGNEWRLYTV